MSMDIVSGPPWVVTIPPASTPGTVDAEGVTVAAESMDASQETRTLTAIGGAAKFTPLALSASRSLAGTDIGKRLQAGASAYAITVDAATGADGDLVQLQRPPGAAALTLVQGAGVTITGGLTTVAEGYTDTLQRTSSTTWTRYRGDPPAAGGVSSLIVGSTSAPAVEALTLQQWADWRRYASPADGSGDVEKASASVITGLSIVAPAGGGTLLRILGAPEAGAAGVQTHTWSTGDGVFVTGGAATNTFPTDAPSFNFNMGAGTNSSWSEGYVEIGAVALSAGVMRDVLIEAGVYFDSGNVSFSGRLMLEVRLDDGSAVPWKRQLAVAQAARTNLRYTFQIQSAAATTARFRVYKTSGAAQTIFFPSLIAAR